MHFYIPNLRANTLTQSEAAHFFVMRVQENKIYKVSDLQGTTCRGAPVTTAAGHRSSAHAHAPRSGRSPDSLVPRREGGNFIVDSPPSLTQTALSFACAGKGAGGLDAMKYLHHTRMVTTKYFYSTYLGVYLVVSTSGKKLGVLYAISGLLQLTLKIIYFTLL